MGKPRSIRFVSAAVLLLVAISGCGGGGGGSGGGPAPPPPPPLAISPAATSVNTNATVTLVAAGGTPPYTYAVTAGSGTVSATGIYTAPASAGSATVTVTDNAGSRAVAALTIQTPVNPVSIFPGSITMPASSAQSYTFTGQNGAGGYQFQLVSGPGTVSANGVYTAGTRSGTATIQVSDQGGATATATVKSVFVRTNGPVHSAVTDGTHWYLGGSFSAVNAYQTPYLAAIDPTSGAPKLACDLQDGFDDIVLTTVSDGAAIFVGGKFRHYRGTETPGGLVKIDPVTCQVIRTYFLPTDMADYTNALLVSGTSLLVNAHARFYRGGLAATSMGSTMMRIDTVTGNRDPAFMVTTPVGELPRIFATATAVYAGHLKLDAVTGALDPNFLLPFPSTIYAYVASGNSLLLAGMFGNGLALRKVDANTGALDSTFNPGLSGYVYDLALVGNSLFVAGTFNQAGAQDTQGLAKMDATSGVVDTTFAPPGSFTRTVADGGVHAMLYDNGSLYVAGNFVVEGNSPARHIAKLNAASGAIDTNFTPEVGLSDTGLSLAKLGSTLFVGGKFVAYRGTPAANLAKLNIATGVADPTFTGIEKTDGRILAMALYNGYLYLGGEFLNYNGASAQYLAKVNANSGALDTNFTQPMAGPNMPVKNIAASSSGLFISGDFVVYQGSIQHGFAKLSLVDSTVDATFMNGFTDGSAGPIALHGPNVYTDTSSAHYGALVYPGICRINAQTGDADPNFPGVPDAGQYNVAISFLGDTGYASRLGFYLGGGDPSTSILKFDGNTGVVDTTFATSYDQVFVPIMALRGLGSSLYVAATPVRFAGDGYGYFLAKLNATTGAMDTTFAQPSATTNGTIHALETTGTDLWVGGEFSNYRGAPAYYFVKIDPATGAVAEPQ